ncbi:MAG: type III pantothenate kinase [Mucispirillum sp.]|uniref:Type III pantothenate kinase n=1 Tax=Candidatus Mucispirillum faecigallinarum TaxID=2838699 RepID=A0A9D2GTP2_9BACT|nr:type III pantothenate kinase [Mucispirillum sp.]HIZ89174.1 type III pantothenate kinase [Candidatus Mucispirillum faecigallinarum]
MILTVDIGNTNTVFGIYNGEKLVYKFRIQSIHDKTTDEYASLLLTLLERNQVNVSMLKGAVIGSVVPQLQYTFTRMIKKYLNIDALLVNSELETGITMQVDNPKEVGADRIANAVACVAKYGKPCIVIDFGTATTFDIINSEGAYIGGIICPGIMLASKMLRSNTAQLPEVSIKKPASVIGKNTVHHIQSGIYFGYLEMINGLLRRVLKEEFSNYSKVNVIITGGLGNDISHDMELSTIYEPNLTLDGLMLLYNKNR